MVSKVASMRQPLKLLLKVFSARARNRGSSYKGYKSINGGSRIICLSMNLLVFLGLDSFIPHLRWETVQHKVGDFTLPSLSWIEIDILPHKQFACFLRDLQVCSKHQLLQLHRASCCSGVKCDRGQIGSDKCKHFGLF